MTISNKRFDSLITRAMDELPQDYIKNLDNVAITFANEPTLEQLNKQSVRRGQLLLGLYEGTPQTRRGAGYNLVLPDKITLFKNPLCLISTDEEQLFDEVKRTLWHEIAHHYGLNHANIDSKLK